MTNTSTYVFFIGTTAELIKLLPVIRRFEKQHIPFTLVSSGQNELPASLLQNTTIDIQIHKKILFPHIFWVILWFFETMVSGYFVMRRKIQHTNKSILIVHGDTISSLMGAVLGRALGCKVAHIESGLRSYNYTSPFPEEIDRLIISRLATYHFCPNEWAVDNLRNTKGVKINTKQNTLWEQHKQALKKEVILPKQLHKPYFLFVIHRQENLYNRKLMHVLINEVLQYATKLNAVFILHEPTKIVLEQYDLIHKLQNNKRVILLLRQDYFIFTHIIKNSQFMVTDGGSNQEESYYLGKPCLILRSVTERIEGLHENVVLSKNDFHTIRTFFSSYRTYQRKPLVSNSEPSKIITDYLLQL